MSKKVTKIEATTGPGSLRNSMGVPKLGDPKIEARNEIEMKKEFLMGLGLKIKDFGLSNLNRVYNEMIEY
jgi:hypothetical protein